LKCREIPINQTANFVVLKTTFFVDIAAMKLADTVYKMFLVFDAEEGKH